MRASAQFPREKLGLAANSNASSETAKAKIISSSVCSSGFIVVGTLGADEREESPSRENIRTATHNRRSVNYGNTHRAPCSSCHAMRVDTVIWNTFLQHPRQILAPRTARIITYRAATSYVRV